MLAGLAIVVGAALRLYWALMLPFNDAPDEFCHYAMAALIASEKRLPTMADVPDRVPVSYPALSPVGYFPCAATGWFADLTAPGGFRWARIGNVLVGAATLAVAFAAALSLFPARPEIAVALVWALALHPQLVFVNAYVNNDSAMTLACAVVWLLWVRIVQSGLSPRLAVTLGIAIGLGVLTKTNAAAAALAGAPIVLLQLWHGRWRNVMLAGAVAALACLPWLAFSYWHHQSLTGVEIHRQWWFDHLASQGIVQPRLTAKNVGDFVFGTWQSFWAVFGYCSTFVGDAWYMTMTLATGIALGVVATRCRCLKKATLLENSPFAALAASLVLGIAVTWLAHATHSAKFGMAAQGRYLFPALWPIAVGLAAGFVMLFPLQRPIGRGGRILEFASRHGGGTLLIALLAGLQLASIDVEKSSNRIRQGDRRVRCRLRAYAGPVYGEAGACLASQVALTEGNSGDELDFDDGVYRWRGDGNGSTIRTFPTIEGPTPRFLHLRLRPVAGLENAFTVDVDGSQFAFHPSPLGLCEYRFDLRNALSESPPAAFELRVEGAPFELYLHDVSLR